MYEKLKGLEAFVYRDLPILRDVTHVIANPDGWRQGAMSSGISWSTYIVRPAWLDECVETRSKAEEESYDYRLV